MLKKEISFICTCVSPLKFKFNDHPHKICYHPKSMLLLFPRGYSKV